MGEAFITRRGAGSGLILKVVGGTTQPASPKDNTIWVNTSTAITSYALQHDEPASPASGMVWIQTSYYSLVEMGIDKKNDVKVYPIAAFQYIGGAWVDKDAKSYINGQWKDWVITVYNGEADISHWVQNSLTNYFYTEDGFVRFTVANPPYGFNAAYDTPLGMTNIATVRFYGYAPRGVQVGVARGTYSSNDYVASAYTPDPWTKTDPLTYVDVDVSNLTGDAYIKCTGNEAYIKRIILIPIGGNI